MASSLGRNTLYGVTTARLNEQVRRNAGRFPEDFMFQLGKQEFAALMSQIATSNSGRGGRRKLPYDHEKAKLVYAGTLAFIGDARTVLETIDARNV